MKKSNNHFTATINTTQLPIGSGGGGNGKTFFNSRQGDIATDKSQQDAESGAEQSNSISSL